MRSLFRKPFCRFRTDQSRGSSDDDCAHVPRSIADLAVATVGEKINIPGDIASDISCIKRNQTTGSNKSQIHTQTLEHCDKSFPSDACLLQSRRPKLKQKVNVRVFMYHALRAA